MWEESSSVLMRSPVKSMYDVNIKAFTNRLELFLKTEAVSLSEASLDVWRHLAAEDNLSPHKVPQITHNNTFCCGPS
jgi:hypothetical protein